MKDPYMPYMSCFKVRLNKLISILHVWYRSGSGCLNKLKESIFTFIYEPIQGSLFYGFSTNPPAHQFFSYNMITCSTVAFFLRFRCCLVDVIFQRPKLALNIRTFTKIYNLSSTHQFTNIRHHHFTQPCLTMWEVFFTSRWIPFHVPFVDIPVYDSIPIFVFFFLIFYDWFIVPTLFYLFIIFSFSLFRVLF